MMPKVVIETEHGVYEHREVSHHERRNLILATEPGRRFMTSDGTTLLLMPMLDDPRDFGITDDADPS